MTSKLGSNVPKQRGKRMGGKKLTTELQSLIDNGPVPKAERMFIINGWRWHAISVIRDLNRFSNTLNTISKEISGRMDNSSMKQSTKEDFERILNCYDFVCNFNWKALMRVENEIFIPWLTDLLPQTATPLIEDILSRHIEIKKSTSDLGDVCKRLSKEHVDPRRAIKEIKEIEKRLQDMIECASSIRDSQENIFVPYVAAHVGKNEQTVFNNRVIKVLGLLDAQVHLVSMMEAIKDTPAEVKLFKKEIPRIACSLIPVWRRQLYAPITKCLAD